MGKQKKNVEVYTISKEERENLRTYRMVFMGMLMILVRDGQEGIKKFLSDKSPEQVREYAKIWDTCSAHPVGAVFQRPDFEGGTKNENVV